jgi:hypothetical protein
MLIYVEPAGSSANIPFLPVSCSPQQTIIAKPLPATVQQEREAGQGTVIVTNNADGFHRGIEWGQACYIEEDHPVTSTVLADLIAEIGDCEDDLPEDFTVGFLVGFLDALFQARQTYPSGWWEQTRYNLSG